MRYQLITPYWEAPEPRRNEELRYCERVNRERFDTVLMPKGRPTYRDLFSLCAEDAINIVANSDIYFDDTIRLCDKMQPNDCYALTRYERGKLWGRPWWSQDVWIFKGSVKDRLLKQPVDFRLGVAGCDNRIAYEIWEAGYAITNPCLSIKTYHKHESKFRTYDREKEKIPGPYKLLRPIQL